MVEPVFSFFVPVSYMRHDPATTARKVREIPVPGETQHTRMGKPQAEHSLRIGHRTVSWSGRSRCEVLAICTSYWPRSGPIHQRFQTANFAGLAFFEDAKGECGLADYQAVGERARERGWRA